MNRFVLLPYALALLNGCAPTPLAPGDGGNADPMSALERDTGFRWTVRWHDDLKTPAHLEGRTPPMAVTPTDAIRTGREFLFRHASLFRISPGDELTVDDAASDEIGMTHARFTQRKGRVPVWGGELMLHFARDGALTRIHGRFIPIAELPSLTPIRGEDEARVAATIDAIELRSDLTIDAFSTRAPTLWIYPTESGEPRLAWRVELTVEDSAEPMELETFVDAADGVVLARNDMLLTLQGSGIGVFGDRKSLSITERRGKLYLEDGSRRSLIKTYSAKNGKRLPGTAVTSDDPDRWDETGVAPGSAVDAHAHVARAYDYFEHVHNRSGWDGKGGAIRATVHFGDHFNNAFFDGRRLVFGDGDEESLLSPAAALDVVAHEYTHGVVMSTARLGMRGETGALHEAIADIFGCFVSYGLVPGGDWKIGETIHFSDAGRARPLRDIARPRSTGNPRTVEEYVKTRGDRGGVHVNSTIVSHAAYLMTDGDNGLGLEASRRVWYRALSRYLTSNAGFVDAAEATLAAARDLDSGYEDAVARAWLAVGVLDE